ncbi:MAG: RDD family protein [Sandaracinaceae bacterium]
MAYRVRTPENVTFEFEVAGVASRAIAWLIDVLVMGSVILFASQVVSALAGSLGGLASALLLVVVFVTQWWYGALLEWGWAGQTIGKRVVGLRVLSDDGLPLSFAQSVIRNLVRVVDLLPGLYFVGGVTALVETHGRRLGDLAAGTLVVRERAAPRPSAVVPASERYNTFVDDPHVAVAVRRITAPERDAMVGLSLRRERLPLPVRRELFQQLAMHLETRLGVQRPPHFSEEKYVLNLTAVALSRAS